MWSNTNGHNSYSLVTLATLYEDSLAEVDQLAEEIGRCQEMIRMRNLAAKYLLM